MPATNGQLSDPTRQVGLALPLKKDYRRRILPVVMLRGKGDGEGKYIHYMTDHTGAHLEFRVSAKNAHEKS